MNRPAKVAAVSAVCLAGAGAAYYTVPRLIWRALIWILWDPEGDD